MADTDAATGTDWPGLMRLGLGRLRLAPEAFWAMTPAEFQLALEGAGIVAPGAGRLDRAGLSKLMAAFPDATGPGAEREE